MLFPNTQLMFLFPPILSKQSGWLLLTALELAWALMTGSNIAHFAHLGGMIRVFHDKILEQNDQYFLLINFLNKIFVVRNRLIIC